MSSANKSQVKISAASTPPRYQPQTPSNILESLWTPKIDWADHVANQDTGGNSLHIHQEEYTCPVHGDEELNLFEYVQYSNKFILEYAAGDGDSELQNVQRRAVQYPDD